MGTSSKIAHSDNGMDAREAIPRLVGEYDAGRLVPFLGAGMSRSICPDWTSFISNLERLAGVHELDDASSGGRPTADSLTRRGMRAVRLLRRRDPDRFAHLVSEALHYDATQNCPQTDALAQIWWPLVLTTNYDDLFLDRVTDRWDRAFWRDETYDEPRIPSTVVLGRSADDCHAVLRSLQEPGRAILWALHGFLRKNLGRDERGDRYQRLAREMVIGHEEYRRIVHTAVHFRRAFAEVFRDRSFLFLGSSMTDPHLTGLFDEILEVAGPNPRPHYAVVAAGKDMPDAHFFKTRLNTILIPIPNYQALPAFLIQLQEAIEAPRPRVSGWNFAMAAAAWDPNPTGAGGELSLSRSKLPTHGLGADECLAISAGVAGTDLLVSPAMREYLDRYGTTVARGSGGEEGRARGDKGRRTPASGFGPPPSLPNDRKTRVCRHGDTCVYYAVARDRESGDDRRDLRKIADTVFELLDKVTADKFTTVHSQLLGAGARRTTPAVYHLIEMARGYGRWWRARKRAVRLVVHLIDPDVLFAVENARVDIPSILMSSEIRFWVDVNEGAGQTSEMRVVSRDPKTRLANLAAELDIPLNGWELLVRPAPDGWPEPVPVGTAVGRRATLESLGVTPHSVILFRPGVT